MSTPPRRSPRPSNTLGFLLACLLVLLGTSPLAQPVLPFDPYPLDFDPRYDLPLPPAWRDSADFTATAQALRDRIAREGQARVRVELRLPAVESDRLDEDQKTQWRQDQVAARAELLDALPDGSYQVMEVPPLAASPLTLTVGEAALAGLMASERVAEVQASAGQARIAAGGSHSLYLGLDGSLWAWGYNYYGQLGDGTTAIRTTPIQVLSGVTALSTGEYHSLALTTYGNLWVWGWNHYGQLGDGTLTTRTKPISILTGVAALSGGDNHTLALKADGSLWAWGHNWYGQLGDGSSGWGMVRFVPIQVLTGVVDMVAGGYHSLALKSDGSLWAWGDNAHGQLGDGTTMPHHIPTQVHSQVLNGVVSALAAGENHTLALMADGSLWSWGENHYGQLGDGTYLESHIPVQVLTGVVTMAAGGNHSLALKADGSVWAWGGNGSGQVGDGTTTNRNKPIQILTGVADLAGGGRHSLALKSDGSLWAWGDNSLGQLGDGTNTARHIPTKVMAGPPFADVPPTSWAFNYIKAIQKAGITGGCGNGNYCPQDLVTREQMAAFLVRAMMGEPAQDYCGVVAPFADVPASSAFCRYIKRLVELSITGGCGNSQYCPQALVTRDQMAAFIVRAVSGEPPQDYCGNASPFADVSPQAWSCRYIKRLVELGITQGCGYGSYCPTASVTREQMAAFLARAFLGMD